MNRRSILKYFFVLCKTVMFYLLRMKVVEVFAVAGAFVVAVVAAEQQQQQLHTKQACN